MSDDKRAIPGQADPLDRGTGAATSGGGLTNRDFVPKTGDEHDDDGDAAERTIVVDDELQRPPERRSPLS